MFNRAPSQSCWSQPATIWQCYIGLLVVVAEGTGFSLVLMNKLQMWMGVYKFPYPLVVTLFQLFLTWMLVLAAAHVSRLRCLRSSIPRPIQTALAPRRSPSFSLLASDPADLRNAPVRPLAWQGQDLTINGSEKSSSFDPAIARHMVPLAVIYFAKVVLSNLSFAQAQLPMYHLTRITIVPLSLLLTSSLNGTSHSAATISSSLVASLHLLIATTSASFHVTPGSLALGFLSSVCTALYPIVLLQTFQTTAAAILASQRAPLDPDHDPAGPDSVGFRAERQAFWLVLRYTSSIATVILLPIVLFSAELADIRRNCYVLDVKVFWLIFVCSGIGSFFVFVSTLLLVRATSPLTTTFLHVPRSAFELIVLSPSRMPLHSVLGITMCWLSSLWFLFARRWERSSGGKAAPKSAASIVRNLVMAAVLYGSVYQLMYWSHTGLVRLGREESLSWRVSNAAPVNPHANWINRPETAVAVKDDYLRPRPHVDSLVNLSHVIDACNSFYGRRETNHDGRRCLQYLAQAEDEYFYLPEEGKGQRASEQDPRRAEYGNADGHDNTAVSYVSPEAAEPASEASLGSCAGPIIPFHVYWTGPASWRVELFIKSYLYTQNLPCSRLWLWVDADGNPDAPEEMLQRDPLFQRFRPLVTRGDVLVKTWRFPTRVALPEHVKLPYQADGDGQQVMSQVEGEVVVADGVVRDMDGRHWLVFPPKLALFPEVVSDLVRFVVLHLHGGIYCDMDILLLRDARPLLLPDPKTGQHSFAEHWVERSHPADYNTAVMSLTANSSLSTYLLQGGLRMKMNYHPKVIGRMAWKDGRNGELLMLDTAFFDPSTTTMNHVRGRQCSVPCHTYYSDAFIGKTGGLPYEWRTYDGPQLEVSLAGGEGGDKDGASGTKVLAYEAEKDPYRPSNRTLENFFRGAWAYHIHNQWSSHPEPSSWLDVIRRAQDGFLQGRRTNAYGEKWAGPRIDAYDRWPEFG